MTVSECIELLRRFPQNAEVMWQGNRVTIHTEDRCGGRFDYPLKQKDLPDWTKPDKDIIQ